KGGEYSIGATPTVWQSGHGLIDNGEQITVRGLSSSSFGTSTEVVLTIGDQSDTFTITTELDNVPNSFNFANVSQAPLDTVIYSQEKTIVGLATSTDIEIGGTGLVDGEYGLRIDG